MGMHDIFLKAMAIGQRCSLWLRMNDYILQAMAVGNSVSIIVSSQF